MTRQSAQYFRPVGTVYSAPGALPGRTTPSLTHIRLFGDAYTACFRCYRDQLGVEPTFGDAESGYAVFESGDVTLAVFDTAEQASALHERPPAGHGRDGVCVVLRVDDVDETADTLRAQGAEPVAAPTDHPEWGVRTIHTRDPDGTLIEFNEPLDPRTAWVVDRLRDGLTRPLPMGQWYPLPGDLNGNSA